MLTPTRRLSSPMPDADRFRGVGAREDRAHPDLLQTLDKHATGQAPGVSGRSGLPLVVTPPRSSGPGSSRKTGMPGAAAELGVGGVGGEALDEPADLPAPPLEVDPQDRYPVLAGTSTRRTVSTRRPTRSSASPAARTLRTHWVLPRGATRKRSPSSVSRLTGTDCGFPVFRPAR